MTRLRDLREEHDLKQIDVAKILCITQAQYSRIENGEYELDYSSLNKIADLYKTSVDYLLCRTDLRSPYPKSLLYEEPKK